MSHLSTKGVLKTTKLLIFSQNKQKKNIILVKLVINLNFWKRKVIFAEFHAKEINKLVFH